MPLKIWGMALGALAMAAVQPVHAQDASTKPFQNPNPEKEILRPGANSFAEGQARSLIESQGYSQVSTLVNDASGIWRGTAVRDNRQVEVSVDYRGHVVAQ